MSPTRASISGSRVAISRPLYYKSSATYCQTQGSMLTPPASFAFSSVCSCSSRVEKTVSRRGSSFIASYQCDLLHREPGAAMCRMSSASSVTSKLGPIRAGEPIDPGQTDPFDLITTNLMHTISLKSFSLRLWQSRTALLPEQPRASERRGAWSLELPELRVIDDATDHKIRQQQGQA